MRIGTLSKCGLRAVKLESENNQPAAARSLLAKARERAGTERVWMKSVLWSATWARMRRR